MQESVVDYRDRLTEQAVATEPRAWLLGPEDVSTRRPRDGAEHRAVGLGWFSVGLGLAQLLAPGGVARLVGVPNTAFNRLTMRACGVRELGAGLGILAQPRPNALLWARVAGDLLDLALLTTSLVGTKHNAARLGVATTAVLGVTALDAKTALDVTRARRGEDIERAGVDVTHSITIHAQPSEVYAFWRDFSNLPKFLAHLESVEVRGDGKSGDGKSRNGTSLWRAKAPAGMSVEWEAEITKDEPNALIEWRSLPGSIVPNCGRVRFEKAPGNRGTEVHVALTYEPPGGSVAAIVAKLFGEEPKQQIKSDLRRLKQVIETGEVIRSDASIHAGRHAAQPAGDAPEAPEVHAAAAKRAAPAGTEPIHTKTAPTKPVGQESRVIPNADNTAKHSSSSYSSNASNSGNKPSKDHDAS